MWKEDERDDDDADTEVLALQAWSNDAGDPLKEWFYRVYNMYVCIYTHTIAISF